VCIFYSGNIGMQRINRHDFLHYLGYGALSLPMNGNSTLVPLGKRPKALPAVIKPLVPFGTIEQQANALLTGYNLPGIAIGLIRENKLVYARGFGVENVVTRKPMTEYSIMIAASMSKTLTGAAVLQLQEAGLLKLDDPYVQHVPYFRMEDPRYKDITIRHLLAHTSGLPEPTGITFYGQGVYLADDNDDVTEHLVRSLAEGVMLEQDPGGSQFIYGSHSYNILAALIHEVTGELFEDYQRHHILDPLHMFKSTFLKREVKPWNLVALHVRDESGAPIVWEHYQYARVGAPSGYLFTNIVDFSNWIMANMNGGFYYNRIMQPETQAQLWVSLYDGAWGWPGVGYNSGFWLMNYAEDGIGPVRMILGAGGGVGINTHATIFPEQGIAAVVFVNLKAKPDDPSHSWGICDHLAIQMLRGEL
jgi:CubicO group peptidase (beta-lactamase class C family)